MLQQNHTYKTVMDYINLYQRGMLDEDNIQKCKLVLPMRRLVQSQITFTIKEFSLKLIH